MSAKVDAIEASEHLTEAIDDLTLADLMRAARQSDVRSFLRGFAAGFGLAATERVLELIADEERLLAAAEAQQEAGQSPPRLVCNCTHCGRVFRTLRQLSRHRYKAHRKWSDADTEDDAPADADDADVGEEAALAATAKEG